MSKQKDAIPSKEEAVKELQAARIDYQNCRDNPEKYPKFKEAIARMSAAQGAWALAHNASIMEITTQVFKADEQATTTDE